MACLKHTTTMPVGQGLTHRSAKQGVDILAAGYEFRLHPFSLAPLLDLSQQRPSQHVQQPLQSAFQAFGRHLTEILGVTCLRGRIHLTAARLYKRHQTLLTGKPDAAKKQQMLQEMSQPWVSQRLIMATGIYPQTQRHLAQPRLAEQPDRQTVIQAQANKAYSLTGGTIEYIGHNGQSRRTQLKNQH